MKLIDKDALVAEIEKRLEFVEKRLKMNNSYTEEGNTAWKRDKALYDTYNFLLLFINNLEVKEVDDEPRCKIFPRPIECSSTCKECPFANNKY